MHNNFELFFTQKVIIFNLTQKRNFRFTLIWLRDHSFKTSANFHYFLPLPPTIGIPEKCLWRGFLTLMCSELLTIGTWGHPSPPKACWRLKWMVPNLPEKEGCFESAFLGGKNQTLYFVTKIVLTYCEKKLF